MQFSDNIFANIVAVVIAILVGIAAVSISFYGLLRSVNIGEFFGWFPQKILSRRMIQFILSVLFSLAAGTVSSHPITMIIENFYLLNSPPPDPSSVIGPRVTP